jgi:competence CoiA-like predicted nuclease
LEFQCSTIPEEVLNKRTETYLKSGYVPLWILGGKNLQEKYRYSACLTSFHYLFLRKTSEGLLWIPSFSPDQDIFHFLWSIFPYSTKNSFLQKTTKSIYQLTLSDLLNPSLVPRLNLDQWRKATEQYKLNWTLHPGKQQRIFLEEVYNHQLNLFLFPSEIGLPVPHGLFIQTPPFIWQAYYYMDILQNKLPGDIISFQQLEMSFQKRVCKKEIVLRHFPQIDKLNHSSAYMEYTHLLERLGVLIRKTSRHFQIVNPLMIPKTNREKEEQTIHFFIQNRKLLEKINEKR